jgi:outer membrane protein OmpA-like peptidoglycan-associated protein
LTPATPYQPIPSTPCPGRRTWALGLACSVPLWVAGCQAPPAAPPAPPASPWSESQAQGLRALGFEPLGDDWTLSLATSLLFEFDSDKLRKEQMLQLIDTGRRLRELDVPRVRVEGHSDAQGEAGYNLQLSLRRANTVAQMLALAGWQGERVRVNGFGRERPIADNASEAGRAKNRRVVLIASAA